MDIAGKLKMFGHKAALEAAHAAEAATPLVREAAQRAAQAGGQAAHGAKAAAANVGEAAGRAARAAADRVAEGARSAAQVVPAAATQAAASAGHAARAAAQAVPEAVGKAYDRAAPAVTQAVRAAAPEVADAAVEAAKSAAKTAIKGGRPASVVASAAKSAAKSAAGKAGKAAARAVTEVAVKNAADIREADAHAHTVRNESTGQDVVVEAYVRGPGGARDYAHVYPAGAKDDFGPVGNKAVGALLVMAGIPMLVLPGPGAAAIAAGMYYLRKASTSDTVLHADAEVSDAGPDSTPVPDAGTTQTGV